MTNLIETMAKAMARRIVRAETIKMNLTIGESELAAIERSADRLAPQCYEDASAALAAIEAAGYRVVPVSDADADAAVRWADAVLQRSLLPRAALSPESIVVAKFVKSALAAAPKVTP